MCLSTKLHQKIFLNFKDKELSFSVKFQSSNFAEYALLVKFTFSLRIFLSHVITGVFSKSDFEIIVGYRFKRQLHKNSQKHSNNSSTKADELFECVWSFCEDGA